MYGRWGFRGAVIGLLLAIGWDTSRQAALLAGDRSLRFAIVLLCGAGGAVAGLALAFVLAGARAGRELLRR